MNKDVLNDSYVRKCKLRFEIDVIDSSRFWVSSSTTRLIHIQYRFLNEGQDRRVSAYKGFVSLIDVLRIEVLEERRSDKSKEIIKEKREENRDSEKLGEGEPKSGKSSLKRKILSLLKEGKKSGEMLIMDKTPSSIDDDDLLMKMEVSGSQSIRDDLRRLVRGYLNEGLSLLEMDHQPNE